jgi:CelD/BcsL family acetyltransferase involved in cellulose biosynthesis
MRCRSGQYHHFGRADIFDRPWIVDVADYLFSTHSDQFGGQLPVLYAGETPVAAHFGLRSGHVLARWFPECDPGFSRQSPGLIQHMRMAEETAALDIHLINLSKGAERYKTDAEDPRTGGCRGNGSRGTVACGGAPGASVQLDGWALGSGRR